MQLEREHIIKALEDKMVQNGADRKEARSVLATYSDIDLRTLFARRVESPKSDTEQLRADAQREAHEARLRAEVERALEYERLLMEKEKRVKAEAPKRKAEAVAKNTRAQKVFAAVCRKHHVSTCEANFYLLSRSGLLDNEYIATEAITSNAVSLAPASDEQVAAFRQEAVEQRNSELLHIAENDPTKLRAIVREEAAEARIATAQTEAEQRLQAERARDSQRGFPPLPDTWNGNKLDTAFIKSCSVEVHKLLTKRFGAAQLTARLRGLA